MCHFTNIQCIFRDVLQGIILKHTEYGSPHDTSIGCNKPTTFLPNVRRSLKMIKKKKKQKQKQKKKTFKHSQYRSPHDTTNHLQQHTYFSPKCLLQPGDRGTFLEDIRDEIKSSGKISILSQFKIVRTPSLPLLS